MTTNSLYRTDYQHWLILMISNDTPYTPTLKKIKQSKLNCKRNNIAAVLPITGHPNETIVLKIKLTCKNIKKILAVSSSDVRD